MKGYVIGADGGNTKTHYALFDENAKLINFVDEGTASHERFAGGFDDARKALEKGIKRLIDNTGIDLKDISHGVFGLAGADTKDQVSELEKRIKDIGIDNIMVCNDAYLGIKAGAKKGYGVCSINVTATSCAAIDKNKDSIQIGGTGFFFGDEAGGGFIEGMVVRKVYDSCFRLGMKTMMKDMLFEALGITDDNELIRVACESIFAAGNKRGRLCHIAFLAAGMGDEAAVDILVRCARELARSVGGAVQRLDFKSDERISIVMAGSVYVKAESPILMDTFISETQKHIDSRGDFTLLTVPPVAGAVIWALERAGFGEVDDIRESVIQSFNKKTELK